MPRNTLKLPAKTEAEKAEARSSPRKPIRGGSKPSRGPARGSPPPGAGDKPKAKRSPAPAQERPQALPAAPRPAPGDADDARKRQRAPARAQPARAPSAESEAAAKPLAIDPWATARRLHKSGGRDPAEAPPPSRNAPRAATRQTDSRPRREPGPTAPAATAPSPARPPRGDHSEPPRLSKRMGELGLCSRREADEWIENGWVRVDGVVVDTLGSRVSPQARIEVDAAATQHQSESVTILIHKPLGYVSGQAEDGHEPASVLIRPENRWSEDGTPTRFKLGHLRGLAPAGRLDIDSTGLLVFTQDGRVAKRLVGENSTVEKEYLVRVEGSLSEDGMKLLNHGLELDGVKLKPAHVSWQNEDQLRFVLREGRKRQIRRMCELVGLAVTGLKRVRIGSVVLGKLPVGEWRYLRFDEKF